MKRWPHDRPHHGDRRRAARAQRATALRIPAGRRAPPRERIAHPRGGHAGAAVGVRLARDAQRSGRRTSRRRRCDGSRSPCAVGGDRALRRDPADRGFRTPWRFHPCRGRLGCPDGRRRCPARSPRGGARVARRNGAPPHVPGTRGGPPPRRAAQRPAPGEGRSSAPGRGGVRRDDLRLGRPVPPPGRRNARDRRGPGARPAPTRL